MGALALAGLPIFNGFWSKELILEAGLKQGPLWAYGFMLFGAGLTAFYTIRMTWMVFFGAPRADLHVHASGMAMRIATGALAVGTLCTWLLAGPLSGLLARSLPFHQLETISTLTMAVEVLSAPATWLALLVIAAGAGLWLALQRSAKPAPSVAWFDALVASSFGLEWVNSQVLAGVKKVSTWLQKTQTGELNWNVLGIVGALLVVLAILAWGA